MWRPRTRSQVFFFFFFFFCGVSNRRPFRRSAPPRADRAKRGLNTKGAKKQRHSSKIRVSRFVAQIPAFWVTVPRRRRADFMGPKKRSSLARSGSRALSGMARASFCVLFRAAQLLPNDPASRLRYAPTRVPCYAGDNKNKIRCFTGYTSRSAGRNRKRSA